MVRGGGGGEKRAVGMEICVNEKLLGKERRMMDIKREKKQKNNTHVQ